MWQIHAYPYEVMIVGDIRDCVSTPTVCAFIYDVFHDLILEIFIYKN